jgi:hypothetical protein
MRRAIEFCRWQADWWDQQKDSRTDVAPHIAQGIRAYAVEHADVERRRSVEWTAQWMPIRKRAEEVLKDHLGDKDSLLPLANLPIDIEEEPSLDSYI